MSEEKVYSTLRVMLVLLCVVVISSLVTRYHIQSIQEKVDYLGANKINVQMLDQDAMLGLFSKEGYNIQTQYEYLDLLKILLKENNIILLEPTAIKFSENVVTLAVHPIDTLRQAVADLGIENPRIANADKYAQREVNQLIVVESLLNNVMPNLRD
ncbi:hypothetical protein ACRWQL_00025 (plasmid) [Shewanella sp. HL-SH4]|uniref:hypothetical protein n=1 Tax=Shewanella TaxID=22 RepID=UPI003D7A9E18